MQTPEGGKNCLVVLRRDPNAIIGDGEVPEVVLGLGLHRHDGRPCITEFQRIAKQILKQLYECGAIT